MPERLLRETLIFGLLILSCTGCVLARKPREIPTTFASRTEPTQNPTPSSHSGRMMEKAKGAVSATNRVMLTSAQVVGSSMLAAVYYVFFAWADDDSDTDQLWKQGYGYNNPNSQRRAQ